MTVDGTGRGVTQAAAEIRCFDDVRENVYYHAANMGDFPDSLSLTKLVLDRCVPY